MGLLNWTVFMVFLTLQGGALPWEGVCSIAGTLWDPGR